MALGTSTIEMQSPEEHRERLHEQVKAARAVLVLWHGPDGRLAAQRLTLLDTDDDTTMYAAGSIDAGQAAALVRDPRVTVVVPGDEFATFDAEAMITHDRDRAARAVGNADRRGELETADTVLVLLPLEGAYWSGRQRNVYQYRLPRSSGERNHAGSRVEA